MVIPVCIGNACVLSFFFSFVVVKTMAQVDLEHNETNFTQRSLMAQD